MIIFGTKGLKFTISEGNFECPQCDAPRRYKFKKVTRYFTLYFIPLIPLGKLGEYVECQTCKGTFIPKVLDYDRDAQANDFLAEYEKAIKHSMILIMLADGEIDEGEMLTVHDIVNKFTHHDIELEQLRVEVARIQKNPEDISTYLKRVSPSLNEHGKELIIRCAFSVAAADGNIDDSELKLIQKMASIMDIPQAHLKQVLDEMLSKKQSYSAGN